MFGKLIKNEFRNIGKLLLLINVIVLGMHLLSLVFEQIYNSGVFNGTAFESIFSIFGGIYIMSLFAINIIMFLVFAARFYRKVYSVEGYLTHTLPVKKSAIYFAMLISSSVSTIITALVSFGYVLIRLTNELMSMGKFSFSDLINISGNYNITELTYFLIVLGIIVTVFAYFALVFLCISIGQNWKAHPVLGSILSYWGITTVTQILATVWFIAAVNLGIPDSLFSSYKLPGDFINTFAAWGIGTELIGIAIMSVISIVIMKKRINL